jgi:hypothetical protein
MRKPIIIIVGIIGIIIVAVTLTYSIISYNIKANAKAIISEDYLSITYNDEVYKSYIVEDARELPDFSEKMINATVENRLFLWDCFLTDHIYISNDGIYINLITDYDDNRSDYYRKEE